MKKTGADILIETLISWGVDVVFGLPGDGINGIIESLRKRQKEIRFIQVRHEEAAAFMACGYAKVTGKLGVCLATSGPGGIHLLNGLYDAKMDGHSVLAITGMQFHDLLGTRTQQDVELDKLFMDVSLYNERVMGPAHVANVANLACRAAITGKGVAHLTFPVDLQSDEIEAEDRSERNVAHHNSSVRAFAGLYPNVSDLEKAAEVLNAGKKIAILVGQGALHATDEVEALADKLAAPVVKALLGKAVLPDDSPYTTGGIGLLGTLPSQEAMENCDTLLMIGTSFPYIEFYPKPGDVRAVQIDADASRIGLRCPIEVGVVGDSQRSIAALLPLLQYHENRDFLEDAQKGVQKWRELMNIRANRESHPMKPQVVAHDLGERLDDDAIVVCDSGTIAAWFARYIPVKRGQIHTLSGNLATMACGLPYAIAAQVAYPNRQVVAFVGDGGLSMLMAELATCAKYQLPIKIVVIKNNSLAQIKWEQIVFLGNPEYECDLQPIDFVKVAEACGVRGYHSENASDIGNVLSHALQTRHASLVEAVVDPFEPPMPAKVTLAQAAKFAESLIKGTPHRGKIAMTIASDRIHEMI